MGLLASMFADFTDKKDILDCVEEDWIQAMAGDEKAGEAQAEMKRLWDTYKTRLKSLHGAWQGAITQVRTNVKRQKLEKDDQTQLLNKVDESFEFELRRFARSVQSVVLPKYRRYTNTKDNDSSGETTSSPKLTKPAKNATKEEHEAYAKAQKVAPKTKAFNKADLDRAHDNLVTCHQTVDGLESSLKDLATSIGKATWPSVSEKKSKWDKLVPDRKVEDASKWQTAIQKTVKTLGDEVADFQKRWEEFSKDRESDFEKANDEIRAIFKYINDSDAQWKEALSGIITPQTKKDYAKYQAERVEILKMKDSLTQGMQATMDVANKCKIAAGKVTKTYFDMRTEAQSDIQKAAKLLNG